MRSAVLCLAVLAASLAGCASFGECGSLNEAGHHDHHFINGGHIGHCHSTPNYDDHPNNHPFLERQNND